MADPRDAQYTSAFIRVSTHLQLVEPLLDQKKPSEFAEDVVKAIKVAEAFSVDSKHLVGKASERELKIVAETFEALVKGYKGVKEISHEVRSTNAIELTRRAILERVFLDWVYFFALLPFGWVYRPTQLQPAPPSHRPFSRCVLHPQEHEPIDEMLRLVLNVDSKLRTVEDKAYLFKHFSEDGIVYMSRLMTWTEDNST